jgi:hypothetical protein
VACLTGRARTVQFTERDVAILRYRLCSLWTKRYGTYGNSGRNGKREKKKRCRVQPYLTNERNLGWVLWVVV